MEAVVWTLLDVVFVAVLALSILTTRVLWNRVSDLRDHVRALQITFQEKAEPKELQRAIAVAEGSADRIDNAVIALEKFKNGVRGEMQRFYGIMRRNEKAFGRTVEGVLEKKEEEYPDEIPAGDLAPKEDEAPEEISKAELRRQAREAGMKI